MRLARAASRTSSEPLPTSPFWTRTRRGETVEIPSSSPGGTRNEVIELSSSSPDGAWEEGYGFLREASTSSDGGQEDRWWDHILEGERETEGMSETERNFTNFIRSVMEEEVDGAAANTTSKDMATVGDEETATRKSPKNKTKQENKNKNKNKTRINPSWAKKTGGIKRKRLAGTGAECNVTGIRRMRRSCAESEGVRNQLAQMVQSPSSPTAPAKRMKKERKSDSESEQEDQASVIISPGDVLNSTWVPGIGEAGPLPAHACSPLGRHCSPRSPGQRRRSRSPPRSRARDMSRARTRMAPRTPTPDPRNTRVARPRVAPGADRCRRERTPEDGSEPDSTAIPDLISLPPSPEQNPRGNPAEGRADEANRREEERRREVERARELFIRRVLTELSWQFCREVERNNEEVVLRNIGMEVDAIRTNLNASPRTVLSNLDQHGREMLDDGWLRSSRTGRWFLTQMPRSLRNLHDPRVRHIAAQQEPHPDREDRGPLDRPMVWNQRGAISPALRRPQGAEARATIHYPDDVVEVVGPAVQGADILGRAEALRRREQARVVDQVADLVERRLHLRAANEEEEETRRRRSVQRSPRQRSPPRQRTPSRRRRTPPRRQRSPPRRPRARDPYQQLLQLQADHPKIMEWRHRLRVFEEILRHTHPLQREHISRTLDSQAARVKEEAQAILRYRAITGMETKLDISWPPSDVIEMRAGAREHLEYLSSETEEDDESIRGRSPPPPYCRDAEPRPRRSPRGDDDRNGGRRDRGSRGVRV